MKWFVFCCCPEINNYDYNKVACLPDKVGRVPLTFTYTKYFLKKMQKALQNGRNKKNSDLLGGIYNLNVHNKFIE